MLKRKASLKCECMLIDEMSDVWYNKNNNLPSEVLHEKPKASF